MHILVTNDDGIGAPGLAALAQALKNFGKVSVVAPDRNWSGSGHVKTLHRPLQVKEMSLYDGSTGLACDGAPSDCVALALLGLLPDRVDIVVSGINPYPNIGHDLTYSGTVTAAMEAAVWGLPGIAVSLDGPHGLANEMDYLPASGMAAIVLDMVLEHGLPSYTLLNINVPYLAKNAIKGFRITRQGKRVYQDRLVVRENPSGQVDYWIGGDPPTGIPEDGTDIGALSDGFVSVTPVQMDMTAHHMMKELSGWKWNIF